MTELYLRRTREQRWTLAVWLNDRDADAMAVRLRREGYQVALVTRHREIDDWSSERLFPLMP